jgi:Mg-chelatase subunit ChlD
MRILLLASIVVLAQPTSPITKNIALVVDTSGSMGWLKPERTRPPVQAAIEAASAISRQPVDEASILPIAFTDHPQKFPGGWISLPDEDAVGNAQGWLMGQGSEGGTRLLPALIMAMKCRRANLTVVLVTDGEFFNETGDEILACFARMQAWRKAEGLGPAVLGIWQVGSTKPRIKLAALAKVGKGGYVASE